MTTPTDPLPFEPDISASPGHIRNTAEICERGEEQAIKVIVVTGIRDDTRRRILLRMALTAVQLGETQVAWMDDEQAAAALEQMEAEHIKSSIIVPGNFGKKIIT